MWRVWLIGSIPAVLACIAVAAFDTDPKTPKESQAKPHVPPAATLLPTHLPPSKPWPRTFHGYPCTADCSGHEAGYAWAESKDIDDKDDCTGTSKSFIEGCFAFVDER